MNMILLRKGAKKQKAPEFYLEWGVVFGLFGLVFLLLLFVCFRIV
jgi:hypothetical protein